MAVAVAVGVRVIIIIDGHRLFSGEMQMVPFLMADLSLIFSRAYSDPAYARISVARLLALQRGQGLLYSFIAVIIMLTVEALYCFDESLLGALVSSLIRTKHTVG